MNAARRWFGWLLLGLLCACSPDPVMCDFVVVTKTPLEVNNRLLLVRAGIDGKWVTLLIDTGAERTTLSEEAVERLGLKRDPRALTRSTGLGGVYESADAIIPGLVLGGVRFPLERMSVGRFRFGPVLRADGVLGADVLLAFDLDIDVPGRQITLYRARRCPDARPPWSEPSERINGVRALRDRLLIPLELVGVQGMALLDTGAQATTIGAGMASRLGLTAQTLTGDPVVRHFGAGPGSQESRLHRFGILRIGSVVAKSPLLSVLPVEPGAGDALVGEDFIDGRRLWMSFTSREVFTTTARSEASR